MPLVGGAPRTPRGSARRLVRAATARLRQELPRLGAASGAGSRTCLAPLVARGLRHATAMSVNLQAIQHAISVARTQTTGRTNPRDGERADFSALLEQGVATATGMTRRPHAPSSPVIPTPSDGGTQPGGSPGGSNLGTDGNAVASQGTLSEDPHTAGMYVPPDFYHGSSYSPVFDHQDANGNWVHTPRFAGQQVWGNWRGSLPPDYDPNARVKHDPLDTDRGPNYWKQDANGNWVKRETGYGGIPLNDDGTPMFTPDPTKFPEYFVSDPSSDENT
jgi:hypothetical protein